MSRPAAAARLRILPLAITRVDATYGCVGAVAEAGGWVRPEPVYGADLEAAAFPYRCFHWTSTSLGPSTEADARPEDRSVQAADPPRLGPALPAEMRHDFLLRHLDRDVAAAFAGRRSLGMIEAQVERIYLKRSTGGRSFLRAVFRDRTQAVYDWIVPDLAFNRAVLRHVQDGAIEPAWAERLAALFAGFEVFLALGLTKPNDRFPGRFGGCHPLVVGVHSVPDYLSLLPGAGPG